MSIFPNAFGRSVTAMLAIALFSSVASAAPSAPKQGADPLQTAVFAGGCFWGVDAVFRHVKGVAEVESGYAGGPADKANYAAVSGGNTGHAEAVRVRFDPAQVSYRQLLQVFFGVAHDPTQLNRQGPDVGSQYRSAVFYTSPAQQKAVQDAIAQLDARRAYPKPVVTQVVPLTQFHPAEKYHQNYLATHRQQPYIVINDLPKQEQLRQRFPALYR